MRVKCLGHKPSYANDCAAGLDLRSNNDVVIQPGDIVEIDSYFAVEMPRRHFGLLAARSGLSSKHQIKLINDIGVIDEDYRGFLGIKLVNESEIPYEVKSGDRVAQLIVIPYTQTKLIYVDELNDTDRGEGGFGHTGR